MIGSEIFSSVLFSDKPKKKSTASVIGMLETSTIFLLSPSHTNNDSVRKRLPWHASQISSDQRSFVPKPLHVGQAPYGELNENKRGSISGNANPSSGQENRADINNSEPSSRIAKTLSSDRSIAISIASFNRDCNCLFPSTGQANGTRSITTSIVCCL